MQNLCLQPKFDKTQQLFKYVITMQNCMTNTNRRKYSHDINACQLKEIVNHIN